MEQKIQIELDLAEHIILCLQHIPYMNFTTKQLQQVVTNEKNRLAFQQQQYDEEIPF